MKYSINVNGNEKIPFNNNVNYCVGTGRMGLALTKEYYDQLKIVQQDIGFKFIRGHGLFSHYQIYQYKFHYEYYLIQPKLIIDD